MSLLRQEFGASLAAVWLHGSAVRGGLRPDSDVDVLAVVEHPVDDMTGKRLAAGLLNLSGTPGSGKRPLELILFQRSDLEALPYPARCAFMYGEWLREVFASGTLPESAPDPELTLVLAQARLEARPLVGPDGPDAAEMLPAIPHHDIRRAIADLLPVVIASLEGDERNVLLTLARMWHTVSKGDFVPKDVAATWAAERLPAGPASALLLARSAYLGIGVDDWRTLKRQALETVHCLRECIDAALRHSTR